MEAFIATVVRALVEHPERVTVQAGDVAPDGRLSYTVQVLPADARFAIGRDGRLADALRILCWAAARKRRLPRPVVEIVADELTEPSG